MHCKVINNSGMDLGDLEQHIQGMYKHFDDQIGFSKPPTLFLDSDPSNAPNTLGKTAYYDPQTFEIHVYADSRHPKDMLRSIAHELIHHQQNLEGRLDVGGYHGEGYYLHNEALKELEQEAMLQGNHYLREYEDTLKTQENQMSLKEWKNKELFENLMGKWGIKTNILNEKKEFPDLTGDGKVTQADILKGRGVELEEAATSIDAKYMRKAMEKLFKKNLDHKTDKEIETLYATALADRPGKVVMPIDEAEHKCPECEGKGEECKCPKKEEIEETSSAGAGAVQGAAKEDLQESINSILKENKELIKRLLK